jgi:hypothetical protein
MIKLLWGRGNVVIRFSNYNYGRPQHPFVTITDRTIDVKEKSKKYKALISRKDD